MELVNFEKDGLYRWCKKCDSKESAKGKQIDFNITTLSGTYELHCKCGNKEIEIIK